MQLRTWTAGGRSAAWVSVLAAIVTLCLTGLVSVQGQEIPPPETAAKRPPERPKAPGRSTPAAPARSTSDETTFLFTSEIGCSITVDGEEIGAIPAQGLKKAPVSIGQHVVVARSDDGKRQWEQIVEAKGKGQIIVRIDFASAGLVTNEEFDRRAAGVRKAMADLDAAAEAQQSLKAEMQAFRAVQTTDAGRRRVAEDLNRAATIAEQYVDVVTKAIAAAQSANSWAGEPNRIYSQAAATLTGMKWSQGTWQLLRASPAFCHTLPLEEQARLGLLQHAAAFDLGAEALYADPQRIVSVTKKGLADQLGLRNGDRLFSLKSLWDLKVELAQNAGKRLDVEIERKGQREVQALRVPTSFPEYPPAPAD
jgi:hypothetical protein